MTDQTVPRVPRASGSPPQSWPVRGFTLLAIVALFLAACGTPALVFRHGEKLDTWSGFGCLALGWLGLFVGAFGWLANLAFAAGVLAVLLRFWRLALAAGAAALLLGATTFLLSGRELPGDEGGVTKMSLKAIGPGFYLWMGSFLGLVVGALVGLLDRYLSSRSTGPDPGS